MDVTGDSDDSDDTDSDDTDSDDDSDTDSSDTDSSDNNTDTASDTTVSYCASLTQTQCENAYTDGGQAICAMNVNSQSCYAVVASSGMYGSGNFDDGYTAATHEMEAETQKLNTIVGVLGATVLLLTLAFIGGGFFYYKKRQMHLVQM